MATQEDKDNAPESTVKQTAEIHPKQAAEDEAKSQEHSTSKKPSSKNDTHEDFQSRHLWVGNVSSSVTRSELAEQFSRFGDIESVADYPSRNYAFVNFKTVDDAAYAKKSLQGTIIGGLAIRIEFSKGNSKNEGQRRGDDSESASGRTLSEKSKRGRDEASETLWVGFPVCMKMDERKLHRAFSGFGGIKRITTFPGRTYAFVEFHTVKSAARAKNVLQGKLFNDPRVSISFAKSEIGPVDQSSRTTLSPPPSSRDISAPVLTRSGSFVNPRNDRYLGLGTSRPHSPTLRRRPSGDMSEANVFFDGPRYGTGLRDEIYRNVKRDQEYGMNADLDMWGNQNLSRATIPHNRNPPSMDDRWINHEQGNGRREMKKARIGDNYPDGVCFDDSFNSKDAEDFDSIKPHGYLTKMDKSSNNVNTEEWKDGGLNRSIESRQLPGSSDMDWSLHGSPMENKRKDCVWQGMIAKSGTTICRAQCYSIGKALNIPFPDVVNCTARTSLDMLAKHINEVGEFFTVSFSPDGDREVEAFRDFIFYLSEKNRAAVCKVSHKCTLFLVPPSEFVESFLKLSMENNIIGVLLEQPELVLAADKSGIFLPAQPERSLPMSEDTRPKPNLNVPPEHQIQGLLTSIPASFHPTTLTDTPSHPLHQPQANLLPSNLIPPFISAAMPSSITVSSVSHQMLGHVHDNHHQPPIHQEVHQPSIINLHGSNVVPNVDVHLKQDQTTQVTPPLPHMPTNPVMSAPAAYIHDRPVKDTNQNIPVCLPFLQQPPLPQYPHPSMQPKLSSQHHQAISTNVPHVYQDNFSNITATSMPQMQPPAESLQSVYLASDSNQNHMIAPASIMGSIPEQRSKAATQASHPPMMSSTDSEQNKLIELQQKLSEARGDTGGENNKRFHATLELAAALLQQLQNRSTT